MARPWFEQDALWNALPPSGFPHTPQGRADAVADAVIAAAELRPGDPVADLGCGQGWIALALARRGMRVTAVDQHAPFAAALAREAEAARLPIEVVRRDLRAFDRKGAFAATLLWGDTLGCFDHAADDRAALGAAIRSLREGGRVLVQLTPKELAARAWPARSWSQIGDRVILEEHRIARHHTLAHHTWIAIEADGTRQALGGLQRLYAASDLVGALEQAGCEQVLCHGALPQGTGSSAALPGFGPDAETLIAVGRH